ncbi:MAG: DUF669 domain-containing protein [Firmicutes bacterium]|nr:DUF669 domain-containing protein [Bacillota bacterium]
MANEGRELSWDDQIENDGTDYTLLPEGDYDFEVVEFERARHNGSDKLPACNKAIVHIRVKGAAGMSTIKHNLFLHSSTEGLLCAFFTGIGQRKKGEKVTMNWSKVVGSTGRCKVGVRSWKNDKGEDVKINEIKKFYEPAEAAPGTNKGFEAGRF